MLRALFSLQRESAGARLLARTVLATWLLPLFFALLASFGTPAAHAQTGAPAQNVVVLDFAVANGLDPLYGRKAADGLAVELQRSGEFAVVPRQTVEEAVAQQAGLQPPFNNTAQIQLAAAVNANSVFSGKVSNIDISPGRSARVTIEARQLDVLTGDYINGTVVTESADQKLGDVATEILVDEAINKATFAAVRSMRQTILPFGTVLNTARDGVELSIGAQRGVSLGQRYTVLRDQQVPGRNVVERRKIGELKVVRVGRDQSTAVISAGGGQGVNTGDRVRQIYEPGRYPTSAVGPNGNSITPVTAPVGSNAGGGLLRKSSAGLLGLAGLALLVGFAGFGGNDGNSSPPRTQGITEATPNAVFPQPRLRFTAGFNGIDLAQTLDRESVVAYLVYRGTAPGFTPSVSNLQSVIPATFDSSSRIVDYVDSGVTGFTPRQSATFTSTQTTSTVNSNTAGNSTVDVSIVGAGVLGVDTINFTQDQLNIIFTQRPLTIGQTYYYRVGRVTAVRIRSTIAGGNNGNNNNNSGVTTVTLRPIVSPVSDSSGGYTPLFQPVIQSTSGNTDNFSVVINADFAQFANGSGGSVVVDQNGNPIISGNFDPTFDYTLPPNPNVGSGVNQFRFLVSTTPSFAPAATFVSPNINNPGTTAFGTITLDLGNASNIRIPSTPGNPYQAGLTPLYVRVLARNTNDANPTFRVSPTFTIQNPTGVDRTASSGSRFLPADAGASAGLNLGVRNSSVARSAGHSTSPRMLPPSAN